MILKTYICLLTILLLVEINSDQISNNQVRQFPKFIWIYNQEGEHSSEILKLFLRNIERLTKQYQWKVVFLDDSNIKLYVQNNQRFEQTLNSHKNKIYYQNKIDLIKLEILYENGGVWIDFPVFLTESLEWLYKLNTNPDVFNRKYSESSQNPSVFMFSNSEYSSNKLEKYWKEDQKILPYSGYQTWFIAAFPKTSLIQEWLTKYIQYFSRDFDSVYYQNVNQNVYLRNIDFSGKTKANIALQNIIQTKQHELDKKRSSFLDKKREYAVQYYGIWTIKAQQGPSKLSSLAQNNQKQYMKYIIKRPVQLLQLNKKFPKYLIKFSDSQIRSIQQFFFINDPKSLFQYSQGVFFRFVKFNKIFCESHYTVVQDSLFDLFFAPLLLEQMRLNIFSKTSYQKYSQSCTDLKMISQKSAFFGSFFGLIVGIVIILIWKLYLNERKFKVQKKTIIIQDWEDNQQNQQLYNEEQQAQNQQQQEEIQQEQEQQDPYKQNQEDQEYYEDQQEKMNDQQKDQQEQQETKNRKMIQMKELSKQIQTMSKKQLYELKNKLENQKSQAKNNIVQKNIRSSKQKK